MTTGSGRPVTVVPPGASSRTRPSTFLAWAVRGARPAGLRRGAVLPAVVALVLCAGYVVLSSLSLSAEQVAESELGGYDHMVALDVSTTWGDGATVAAATRALHDAGLTDALVQVTANTYRTDDGDVRVFYREADWGRGTTAASPLPGAYRLVRGTWPQAPGEVVVSGALEASVSDGTLSLFSGTVRLTVVGVVVDVYGTDQTTVLAHTGTVATWPAAAAGGFRLADPYLLALWNGPRAAGLRALAPYGPGTVTSASASRAEQSWVTLSPAAFWLPALVLPGFAGAALVLFDQRRWRRSARALLDAGAPHPLVLGPHLLATAVCAALAAAAGVGLGALAGVALRGAGAGLVTRPWGPLPSVLPVLAVVTAGCTAGAATAVLVLWRTVRGAAPAGAGTGPRAGTGTATTPDRGRGALVRGARHWAAVACLGVVVLRHAVATTNAAAMVQVALVVLAGLLVVPEITRGALGLARPRRAGARLVVRRLVAAQARACTAVLVVATVTALPLAYSVLVGSMVATAQGDLAPTVRPGQVLLSGGGYGLWAPPAPVLRLAGASLPAGTASATVRTLISDEGDATGTTGTVVGLARGGGTGVLRAVATADAAATVLATDLTAAQRQVLEGQGVLVLDGQGACTTVDVQVREVDTGTVARTVDAVPCATAGPVRAGWLAATDGLVLAATAGALDLPVLDEGGTVYTGVPDPVAAAFVAEVRAAGLDASGVTTYTDPLDYVPPVAVLVSAGVLGVLLAAVVLALTGAQSRALARDLRPVVESGAPVAWARRVLAAETLVPTALGVVWGVALAVPAAVSAVRALPGFVVAVPWAWVGASASAVVLAAALAAGHASRRVAGV